MLNTIALTLAADGTLTINTATSSALGVSYENEATTVNIDISAVSAIASYTHYIEVMTPSMERLFVNATIAGNIVSAKLPNSCLVRDGFALVQLRSESGTTVVKSKCIKFYIEKSVNAYDEGVSEEAWVTQIESRVGKLEGQVALLIAETLDLNDWSDVQKLVKAGLAEEYLPAGTEITLNKESSLVVDSIGNHIGTQGISAVTITDHEKFLDKVGTSASAEYEFYFDGVAWHFEATSGNPVYLADYGLSVTGVAREGDEFVIHETATQIPFVVLAHGERNADGTIKTATSTIVPHNKSIKHWMVLVSKPVVKNNVFGLGYNVDGAFYVHTAMPAGTYYFHGYKMTIASGATTYDGIYEFTISSQIPAGGVIKIPCTSGWTDNNPLGATLATYDAAGNVIQSGVALTQVSSSVGTDLGYISFEYQNQESYPAHSAYTYNNVTRRMQYATNDYAVSLIRQYINADAVAGAWYRKTNPFAPYVPGDANVAGFLYGVDHTFKDAVIPSDQNYYECDSDYATNGHIAANVPLVHALVKDTLGYDGRKITVKGDKMFLLSVTETNLSGYNDNSAGNTVLEFYKGAVNVDRIKFLNGAARYWWLRSPLPWNAHTAAIVHTDGSLSTNSAHNGNGCVPACIIG